MNSPDLRVARWLLSQKAVRQANLLEFMARVCIQLINQPYCFFGSFFGMGRGSTSLKAKNTELISIMHKTLAATQKNYMNTKIEEFLLSKEDKTPG